MIGCKELRQYIRQATPDFRKLGRWHSWLVGKDPNHCTRIIFAYQVTKQENNKGMKTILQQHCRAIQHLGLAGNVADMSPTCRPAMVMSAILSRKGMSRRHTTRKKRPRHTVFVCLFADTIQIPTHQPTAHAAEEEEEGRRRRPYYDHCRCLGRGVCRR